MLTITVPARDWWDEEKEEFGQFKGQTLTLEHSLVSLSKWESKWHKPFIDKTEKTIEETIDYIRCMTLTKNVVPMTYRFLTNDNITKVNDYISDSMTATWFSEDKKRVTNRKKITSELIYYWMVALNIPFECEKWHLNRLFTLIEVCNRENQPTKKRSGQAVANSYAALNAARRKKLGTKG